MNQADKCANTYQPFPMALGGIRELFYSKETPWKGQRCYTSAVAKIIYYPGNANRLHTLFGDVSGLWSGRRELNPGHLAPHASALAGLRHAPSGKALL